MSDRGAASTTSTTRVDGKLAFGWFSKSSGHGRAHYLAAGRPACENHPTYRVRTFTCAFIERNPKDHICPWCRRLCAADGVTVPDCECGRCTPARSASSEAAKVPDCLRSMTPEEFAAFEPLTEEQLREALAQGKRERDAAISSQGNSQALVFERLLAGKRFR